MIKCIVQLLDYEAQKNLKKKHLLECNKCPVNKNCKKYKKGD